jgi:hypothetical protein
MTLGACGGSGDEHAATTTTNSSPPPVAASTTPTATDERTSAPGKANGAGRGRGKGNAGGHGNAGNSAGAQAPERATTVRATDRTVRREVARLIGPRTKQGQARVRGFHCSAGTCTLRYFSDTGGRGAIGLEISHMLAWLFRDSKVERGIFYVHHINGFAPNGGRATLVLTCDRRRWTDTRNANAACVIEKRKGASEHGKKLRVS